MHLGDHLEVVHLGTPISLGVIVLKRSLSLVLHLIIMSYQGGSSSNS